jgi:hypothetical protein
MQIAKRQRRCHLCNRTIEKGEHCIRFIASRGSAEGNMCSTCVVTLAKTFYTPERLQELIEEVI